MGARRLLTAVATATAVATVTLATTTPAHAQGGLPPIGAEIPMSMLAINTPMRIGTALVSVDFRGGIKQRVDVNPDDPFRSVRLRTVGFRVSAELPDDGGAITVEQNDVDVEASSRLTLTQQFPPRYEHIISVPVTATIDQGSGGGEPLVLTSKDPMTFYANLTQFPPRGDQYQLVKPVELVDPENPDVVRATIEKFPAKIGGL